MQKVCIKSALNLQVCSCSAQSLHKTPGFSCAKPQGLKMQTCCKLDDEMCRLWTDMMQTTMKVCIWQTFSFLSAKYAQESNTDLMRTCQCKDFMQTWWRLSYKCASGPIFCWHMPRIYKVISLWNAFFTHTFAHFFAVMHFIWNAYYTHTVCTLLPLCALYMKCILPQHIWLTFLPLCTLYMKCIVHAHFLHTFLPLCTLYMFDW